MEIHPLDSTTLDAWLDLFENRAFVDHRSWAGCFCQAYVSSDPDWESNVSARTNRSEAIRRAGAGDGGGLLAFDGDVAIGWVRAGAKRSLPNLFNWEEVASADDDSIGSIVCFVVDPARRGQGVASALLEAAVAHLAESGLEWAEGYPKTEATDAAHDFPGPLPLFLKHGFTPVGTERKRTVVRRRLHPPGR